MEDQDGDSAGSPAGANGLSHLGLLQRAPWLLPTSWLVFLDHPSVIKLSFMLPTQSF